MYLRADYVMQRYKNITIEKKKTKKGGLNARLTKQKKLKFLNLLD